MIQNLLLTILTATSVCCNTPKQPQKQLANTNDLQTFNLDYKQTKEQLTETTKEEPASQSIFYYANNKWVYKGYNQHMTANCTIYASPELRNKGTNGHTYLSTYTGQTYIYTFNTYLGVENNTIYNRIIVNAVRSKIENVPKELKVETYRIDPYIANKYIDIDITPYKNENLGYKIYDDILKNYSPTKIEEKILTTADQEKYLRYENNTKFEVYPKQTAAYMVRVKENIPYDYNGYDLGIIQEHWQWGYFYDRQGGSPYVKYKIIPYSLTYEIMDMPGLIYTILTLPFAFISTAFNLTLFPNTPYQINIAQLFLTIIGIFVFIWLIKVLIGLKK